MQVLDATRCCFRYPGSERPLAHITWGIERNGVDEHRGLIGLTMQVGLVQVSCARTRRHQMLLPLSWPRAAPGTYHLGIERNGVDVHRGLIGLTTQVGLVQLSCASTTRRHQMLLPLSWLKAAPGIYHLGIERNGVDVHRDLIGLTTQVGLVQVSCASTRRHQLLLTPREFPHSVVRTMKWRTFESRQNNRVESIPTTRILNKFLAFGFSKDLEVL